MTPDLDDVNAFLAVARTRGFRDASRATGTSASALSEAVRRPEAGLGVRLFNRTTSSVTPTGAGARLNDRLNPALAEFTSALEKVSASRAGPQACSA